MCGRYTLTASAPELADHFDVEAPAGFSPRYNLAPTQEALVVRQTGEAAEGKRLLETRRWGLVPAWARDASVGSRMINARVETVAEKPAFRESFRHARCLVPADGFYEWKPHSRRRLPYHIQLPSRALFAFAGLFARWQDPEGRVLESFTILTTDAAPKLRVLHDRMPVMLDPADYAGWLDPSLVEAESLVSLLSSKRSEDLEFRRVGAQVNDARHEGPGCLEPPPRDLFGEEI